MQVSSNKVALAENASLRSELGGLRSQLSETSKQLEAERATSEAPLFPAMKSRKFSHAVHCLAVFLACLNCDFHTCYRARIIACHLHRITMLKTLLLS